MLVKAAKAGSLLLVDKAFCFFAKFSISNVCVFAVSEIFMGLFFLFSPQNELLTKTIISNATSGLLTGNSKFYLTGWSES